MNWSEKSYHVSVTINRPHLIYPEFNRGGNDILLSFVIEGILKYCFSRECKDTSVEDTLIALISDWFIPTEISEEEYVYAENKSIVKTMAFIENNKSSIDILIKEIELFVEEFLNSYPGHCIDFNRLVFDYKTSDSVSFKAGIYVEG